MSGILLLCWMTVQRMTFSCNVLKHRRDTNGCSTILRNGQYNLWDFPLENILVFQCDLAFFILFYFIFAKCQGPGGSQWAWPSEAKLLYVCCIVWKEKKWGGLTEYHSLSIKQSSKPWTDLTNILTSLAREILLFWLTMIHVFSS